MRYHHKYAAVPSHDATPFLINLLDLPDDILGKLTVYLKDQEICRYIQSSQAIYTCVKNAYPNGIIRRPFYLSDTLVGHDDEVHWVTYMQINGEQLIISASGDKILNIWAQREQDKWTVIQTLDVDDYWIDSVFHAQINNLNYIVSGSVFWIQDDHNRWTRDHGFESLEDFSYPVIFTRRINGQDLIFTADPQGINIWTRNHQDNWTVNQTLRVSGDRMESVTHTQINGQDLLITSGYRDATRFWALDTQGHWAVTQTLGRNFSYARFLIQTDINGQNVIFAAQDETISVGVQDHQGQWALTQTLVVPGGPFDALTHAQINEQDLILSSSYQVGTIQIWAQNNQGIWSGTQTLDHHSEWVSSVLHAQINHQDYIVSSSADRSIKLWKTRPMQLRLQFTRTKQIKDLEQKNQFLQSQIQDLQQELQEKDANLRHQLTHIQQDHQAQLNEQQQQIEALKVQHQKEIEELKSLIQSSLRCTP